MKRIDSSLSQGVERKRKTSLWEGNFPASAKTVRRGKNTSAEPRFVFDYGRPVLSDVDSEKRNRTKLCLNIPNKREGVDPFKLGGGEWEKKTLSFYR